MSPVGAFKCCITACPSAGSSPAVEIQDPPLRPLLPDPSLSPHAGGGDATQAQAPERALCWGGLETQPCGLKVSERLFWRGAGEEGEPAPPLPGSCLGGRHKISQQIMKLSLIAGESRGWRGFDEGGVSCTGGLYRA